ncbi:MAG: hypothetical protein WC340_07275 [Kiritimatiellia bacterium]
MKKLHRGITSFARCAIFMTAAGVSLLMASAQNLSTDSLPSIGAPPAQPGDETWSFINDLKAPLWGNGLGWGPHAAAAGEADLSRGIRVDAKFPDPTGVLKTAYADLDDFCSAGKIATGGPFTIETTKAETPVFEAYRIEVTAERCRIIAADTEGIRRGVFKVQDMMRSAGGPFLQLGTVERKPFIKSRISRCFFGPIKRAPRYRDELMDDVDYYPDQYLNRLAHDGVNGLWLTVEFHDLVATRFTPDAAKDATRRLAKLRRVATQCRRYGIRIYIFTIEPRAWCSGGNNPARFDNEKKVLGNYPELGGGRRGSAVYFCPMTETAQEYLYEVVNKIFKEIPELGGIINISHGERSTTCLSSLPCQNPWESGKVNCTRCSTKAPWEILYASLSAMERGMRDAAPDAELISWHYMGNSHHADWVYEIPAHTPKGVVLQLQFESGVTKTQFGKKLQGGDYWLATPGPSLQFERQAEIARDHGTPVSAKIQTGCSHEVASIPYVAAPSMIYRKFTAMHRLGVSHTMLGWYFGNYPGLMIKAAGELSFNPLPENEDDFLRRLASVYWKAGDVPKVVAAWKYFAEGYGNYPLHNMLGYYGPMHDGPVWPLLLKPVDLPLSPTWQIGSSATLKPWPPSGDRIGECLWAGGSWVKHSMEDVLTLEENVELCRRMSVSWDKGVALLHELESTYRNDPERILDMGVAAALGIQFRSGYNILNFYLLRERMLRMEGRERLDILKQLGDILREELELDKHLLKLCEKDSRLGFHSEAEGYKYFPAKIRWRMRQLEAVLAKDLPEIKNQICDDKLLFPEYTGKKPAGLAAYAVRATAPLWSKPEFDIPPDLKWQPCIYGAGTSPVQWAAAYDADAIYIIASDPADTNQSANASTLVGMTVKIEARRLWPCAGFTFDLGAKNKTEEDVRMVKASGRLHAVVRIPFNSFWWADEPAHPVRVDVQIKRRGKGDSSWCPKNPLVHRLVFGSANPADLGWLFFDSDTGLK